MQLTTLAGAPGRALAPRHAAPALMMDGHHEVLCFRVGQEQYGVDILDVQEIRSFEAPTRLFGAPADLLGVLDLRGSIVPLVDGRTRLGTPAPVDASTVTIVFQLDGRHIGLVVDQVADVQRLAHRDIRPSPMLGDRGADIGVTGLSSAADGALLILLDVRRFLGAMAAPRLPM